jgi:hypothetical protein
MRALQIAAIAASLATAASAWASTEGLTVVVFDYARTPHQVIASAIAESRRTFHAAGVESEWILCTPKQSCYVPERFAQVKILPHVLKSTPLSHNGLAATTTCTATDHCSASYLFSDRIESFAQNFDVPLHVTLAYVMSHEVGHLLGLQHRPGGIMTAGFTSQDLRNAEAGWLTFSAADARLLRAASLEQHASARHILLRDVIAE